MPETKRTTLKKNNIVSMHFDAEFFFERGLRAIKREPLKALKYLKKCVELEPLHIKYLLNLSAVCTEIGDFEESNRLLSKIIHEVDETYTECYYYMANNYAHMGDFDQAEQYALMYLQENSDGLYAEEAEELLDFICFELERTPKELDLEHKLISKHEKARLCLEEGRFLEAAKTLEGMIEEYPQFLAARNNLALSYYYLGKFEQAMQVIQEILDRDKTNLHALCNLAIFYSHKGEETQIKRLIEGLKKVLPIQPEHHFKLATTLGILGEDERAFELYQILATRRIMVDTTLYHYMAVAAYNTGRRDIARKYWLKVEQVDPHSEVADYYLDLLNRTSGVAHEKIQRVPYHYQLPYDVQLKKKEWFQNGRIPRDLMNDPLIRSSLFWALRHGDLDTKLQVIQSFEYFADQEVESTLRQLILEPNEEDYVKKVAIFVLRQIGAAAPYQAVLNGTLITISVDEAAEEFPGWFSHWHKVIQTLRENMEGNYDIVEHQEAQDLWTRYLKSCFPHLPKIKKAEGWAAALEYLIASRRKLKLSKREMAAKYGVSIHTLNKNLQCIEMSIIVDSTATTHYDQE